MYIYTTKQTDTPTSKPKNARAARALKERESQTIENPKTTLFLRAAKCSELTQLLMTDLHSLKRPLTQRFTKKNAIHPFEDPASLEFFSGKNDSSLLLFGSHSKKRPNALTIVRTFDAHILDMIELLLVPDTLRTMAQFKNAHKPAVGLKPLVAFAGTPFENPVASPYTLAKSLLMDLLKGPDVPSVDVEGLQYIICVSAADEVAGQPPPAIHLRGYLLKTMKSGARLPRVEVEEMGPRADFRLGRTRDAEPAMWKDAMRKARGVLPKAKKNVETDLMGDKLGRIHVGKQNLANLQTRKMKGLKRDREDGDGDVEMEGENKRTRG